MLIDFSEDQSLANAKVECSFYHLKPMGFKRERGIEVSWNRAAFHIKASLELSGDAATPQIANLIKTSIEQFWNINLYGFILTCQVDIRFKQGRFGDRRYNQISCTKKFPPCFNSRPGSFAHVHPKTKSICLVTEEGNNASILDPLGANIIAHEFGHILGLIDRYKYDENGLAVNDLGWENALMAGVQSTSRIGIEVIKELLYLYALQPGQSYREEDFDRIRFFGNECRIYLRDKYRENEGKRYKSPPTYIEKYKNSLDSPLF